MCGMQTRFWSLKQQPSMDWKVPSLGAMCALLVLLGVLPGLACAGPWSTPVPQPGAPRAIIYTTDQVGIGFTPNPDDPGPDRVDLQTARDIQTNTNVFAGDGVGVNLSFQDNDPSTDNVQEQGGFSLIRTRNPETNPDAAITTDTFGQLWLDTNDDVRLTAFGNKNLRLEAVGGLTYSPNQVGIGFVPTPGVPQPSNVDLQTARDIQTNTYMTAGNGVRVNLGSEEVGGYSLMRGGGDGVGGLLLGDTNTEDDVVIGNNDVLLTSDQNLVLEALGGEVNVNLGAGEDVRGISLTRSGNAIGGLLVQPNKDVLLTSNNNLRLEASGSVIINKLIVEASGADFVFAKDYPLRSLQEVEQHISMYGTLPDIPSSRDMETNGLALGDMQTKLLQKIEELTLYIIAQNKRLDAQEKRLKKQAKILARLQN